MACRDGLRPVASPGGANSSAIIGESPVGKKVSNLRERFQRDLIKFGDYYDNFSTKELPDLKELPQGTFYLCKSKSEDKICLVYMTDAKQVAVECIVILEDGLSLLNSERKFQKLKHLLKHYKDISEKKFLVSKYRRVRDLKMNEQRAKIKKNPAFKEDMKRIEHAARVALKDKTFGTYIIFQSKENINEFTLLFRVTEKLIEENNEMFTDFSFYRNNIGEITIKIEDAYKITAQMGKETKYYRTFKEFLSTTFYSMTWWEGGKPYVGELCEYNPSRAAGGGTDYASSL